MLDHLTINEGWLEGVEHQPSPHFNERPDGQAISLLVVHNISLPPRQFGGEYITDLFLGRLSPTAHPSFEEIYQMQVSAHCLVKRSGDIVQYVSFNDRAWHAGVSSFCGKTQCNDFSIGIELEGTDDIPYEQCQYQALAKIAKALTHNYSSLLDVAGHCDIAPERKTDPGHIFDWQYFLSLLDDKALNNPYIEEKS